MTTLKRKTFSGVKWQVITQVISKLISVFTFAVLARLLNSEAFGLFALAFVAIDGLSMFKSFGIDAGIIQRRAECNTTVTSTAFYMVQLTGILMFAICFFVAPLAGYFFRNPDAVSVIQALGVIFVTNGFGKIPSALLTKEMRFNLIGTIQLIGAIINSACAISFAKISPSVWSLVLAYVAKALVMDILAWYFSKFKLTLEFDKKIAKEFFRFGSLLMGGNIFGFITENLNNITVGRMLGTVLVGYLALANNIAAFVNTHFTYLILRVLFPAYASILIH